MRYNFEIERFAYGYDTTGGRLFELVAPGASKMMCWTLEDERRDAKVFGETCIGPGSFRLGLRTEGDMHERYADKFGARHKGMIWLLDVPDFTFVYLHIGNWAYEGEEAPDGIKKDDTLGCPLLGRKLVMTNRGEFELQDSTGAYLAAYDRIAPLIAAGRDVWLHVRER